MRENSEVIIIYPDTLIELYIPMVLLYMVCHGSHQQKPPINVSINESIYQHRLDPSWVYLCTVSMMFRIWCISVYLWDMNGYDISMYIDISWYICISSHLVYIMDAVYIYIYVWIWSTSQDRDGKSPATHITHITLSLRVVFLFPHGGAKKKWSLPRVLNGG